MGLFDKYSTPVKDIPTGFGLAVGFYPVVITDVRKVEKEGKAPATVIDFKVDTLKDERRRSGTDSQWINKPVEGEPNADVLAKVAKTWVKDLGIPANVYEDDDFELWDQKDNLVGVEGFLDITAGNKGYTNKKFKLATDQDDRVSDTPAPEAKAEVAGDIDPNW